MPTSKAKFDTRFDVNRIGRISVSIVYDMDVINGDLKDAYSCIEEIEEAITGSATIIDSTTTLILKD